MAGSAAAPAAGHFRFVLAVEASALAVEYFPIFRTIVLDHLISAIHEKASFEVAVITFGPKNGTSRCFLNSSPWTNDLHVFLQWLEAIPSLLEGVGHVAAFDAIADAMSMFEQDSSFTPAHDVPHHRELLMLWLTEGLQAGSCLTNHPDNAVVNTNSIGPMLLHKPQVAFAALAPENTGAFRSLQRFTSTYLANSRSAGTAAGATPAKSPEGLYHCLPCNVLPSLTVVSMRANPATSIVERLRGAIQKALESDEVFAMQTMACSKPQHPSSAVQPASTVSGDPSISKASVAQGQQRRTSRDDSASTGTRPHHTSSVTGPHAPSPLGPSAATPASATPGVQAGSPEAPAAAPSHMHTPRGGQARHGPQQPTAPTPPPNAAPAAAGPLAGSRPASRPHAQAMWSGNVISNTAKTGSNIVAKVQVWLPGGAQFTMQAPPPNTWPPAIELLGSVPPNLLISTLKRIGKQHFMPLKFVMQDIGYKELTMGHDSAVIVLSIPAIRHKLVLAAQGKQWGAYMSDATYSASFPPPNPF